MFKAPASTCLYTSILLTCYEPFAFIAAVSSTFNFFFQCPFHISLMVLVYYRAETNIHLWMKSTTSFALCFQEARLLDASHKERLNMTLRNFTFIAAPPPTRHIGSLSLPWQLHIAICDRGPNCQHELVLVHSPLLKESISVCCPPLT